MLPVVEAKVAALEKQLAEPDALEVSNNVLEKA